jgi:D-alanine-D-alanine ligase
MDDDAVVSIEPGTSIDDILRARDELTGRPHFAEAYIDGREFNLTLLAGPNGPLVLPPAEIDFAAYPTGKPKIVGYRAKWDEDSFEYGNTPRRFEFASRDRELLEDLAGLAVQCWHVFELRGYARVDFRVDAENRPWILEVNANPCLAPDAGFAAAVERAGFGYHEAIGRIVDDANAAFRRADTRSSTASSSTTSNQAAVP